MAKHGKPKGLRAFETLARKVTSVPKEDVDAKIAKDKKARIKARKK